MVKFSQNVDFSNLIKPLPNVLFVSYQYIHVISIKKSKLFVKLNSHLQIRLKLGTFCDTAISL